MQINKINYAMQAKATSFGNNHKCKNNDCCAEPKAEAQMVKVPAAFYKALLGVAMLAATVGGGLSSCSDPVGPVDDRPVEDTLTTSPLQKQLVNMIDVLNLDVVVQSPMDKMAYKMAGPSSIKSSSVARTGDIVKLGFLCEDFNYTEDFALNKNLSQKSTLIFDGSRINLLSGQNMPIRYIITMKDNNELLVKCMQEPTASNTATSTDWDDVPTFKYKSTKDAVLKYIIEKDGSDYYLGKFVPKNGKAVNFIDKYGTKEFSRISIVKMG